LLPWAAGKQTLTNAYMQFLANWARKLSWPEVARSFRTSWQKVFHSLQWLVGWGLERRALGKISAIGVDEIAYSRGHKYLTLVYQIEVGMVRLLWVGKERTISTFRGFFDMLGEELSAGIEFVCSDMWRPYLRVIRGRCGQALHALDRFHFVSHMNQTLDQVRASEARKLAAEGRSPVLKHSRWCLLKRPGNLTSWQHGRLRELVRCNLRTMRAYLLKEDFQQLWGYRSVAWAGKFLDHWCTAALRSRIKPMKTVARMVRKHRELDIALKDGEQVNAHAVVGCSDGTAHATRQLPDFFHCALPLTYVLIRILKSPLCGSRGRSQASPPRRRHLYARARSLGDRV
jgi:transposase